MSGGQGENAGFWRCGLAHFRSAAGWTLGLSMAWWAAEVSMWCIWLEPASEGAGDLALSAFGAAGLVGFVWTGFWLIAGFMFWLTAGREPFSLWAVGQRRAIRQALLPTGSSGRDVLGTVLGAVLWLGLSAYLGAKWSRFCMTNIATQKYIALAAALGSMAIVVFGMMLWPVWRRIGSFPARLAPARMSPRAGLLALLALSSIALGGVGVAYAELIRHLPWQAISTLACLGALFFAGTALRRWRTRRGVGWSWRLLQATWLAVAIYGIALGLRLDPLHSRVRGLLVTESTLLPTAYSFAKWLTDFDEDGYLGWWGENDCAPFDASIHPFAKDSSVDGVDQDCSGQDGRHRDSVDRGRGRYRYRAHGIPTGCPIFLITLDAVSPHELLIYGGSSMPRLSRRAESAVVFQWAFSQGPSTRLSVPSMLTSRYDTQIRRPLRFGQPALIEKRNQTLAEVLNRAKYHTAAVAPEPYFGDRLRGIYQGFAQLDRSPAAYARRPGLHTADRVTAAAKKLIDQHAEERRTFLWVHYYDAHAPFTFEPRDRIRGAPQHAIYRYELEYLDRHLEELLAHIDATYRGRPYIVLVTADHGEAFDKAHRGKRRHGYDLSAAVTRIPFMVWGAGKPGRRTEVVGLIDVTPTVINIAGGSGAQPEGNSLVPLLAGQRTPPRPVFGQFYLNERRFVGEEPLQLVAVRFGGYVLYYDITAQAYRLYNYEADLWETKDLARSQPVVFSRLRSTMWSWLQRVYPAFFQREPPSDDS